MEEKKKHLSLKTPKEESKLSSFHYLLEEQTEG